MDRKLIYSKRGSLQFSSLYFPLIFLRDGYYFSTQLHLCEVWLQIVEQITVRDATYDQFIKLNDLLD